MELENWSNDNTEYFASEESIKSGPRVRIVFGFGKEDEVIRIYVLNYVQMDNPSKKEYVLELLNELNNKYSYAKFTLDDSDNILIGVNIPTSSNYNANFVFDLAIGALSIAEEEYSRFMKLQWG
jgi:hypothetical protein